jgi:hypothetical protein
MVVVTGTWPWVPTVKSGGVPILERSAQPDGPHAALRIGLHRARPGFLTPRSAENARSEEVATPAVSNVLGETPPIPGPAVFGDGHAARTV